MFDFDKWLHWHGFAHVSFKMMKYIMWLIIRTLKLIEIPMTLNDNKLQIPIPKQSIRIFLLKACNLKPTITAVLFCHYHRLLHEFFPKAFFFLAKVLNVRNWMNSLMGIIYSLRSNMIDLRLVYSLLTKSKKKNRIEPDSR